MSDLGIIRFSFLDVEGGFLQESAARVTFHKALGSQNQVDSPKMVDCAQGPVDFRLGAFPDRHYFCDIEPGRYRMGRSEIFAVTPDKVRQMAAVLPRHRDRWRAEFTPWRSLGEEFAELRALLEVSPEVSLLAAGPLGRLNEETYDGLAGDQECLAKAALLNLYFKLRGLREPVALARNWFSFLHRLLAVGRERIIAVVDAEMGDVVRHVLDNLREEYRGYRKAEDPAGHRKNIPEAFRARVSEMLSIKSRETEASLQLTIGVVPGEDFAILDADIDEHGRLLAHFCDWIRHFWDGGTHPYDVHEALKAIAFFDPAGGRRIDLGYKLV